MEIFSNFKNKAVALKPVSRPLGDKLSMIDVSSSSRPAFSAFFGVVKSFCLRNASHFDRPLDDTKISRIVDYVKRDNALSLKKLIQSGCDVNGIYSGVTLLQLASYAQSLNCIDLLIKNGADVNKVTSEVDLAPLFFARMAGSQEVERFLVKAGANAENAFPDNHTPLHYACLKGDKYLIKFLIRNGSNPNEQHPDGGSALLYAISTHDLDLVQWLVVQGAEVNRLFDGGVNKLKEKGIICDKNIEKYLSILSNATPRGHEVDKSGSIFNSDNVKRLQTLINDGLNINGIYNGMTLLQLAAHGKAVNCIDFLIKKGADVDKVTNEIDATPLFLACMAGSQEAKRRLIEAGASVEKAFPDNHTSLYYACLKGDKNLIKFMISNGADPNKQHPEGGSVLLYALSRNDLELVRWLVNHGASTRDVFDKKAGTFTVNGLSCSQEIKDYLSLI